METGLEKVSGEQDEEKQTLADLARSLIRPNPLLFEFQRTTPPTRTLSSASIFLHTSLDTTPGLEPTTANVAEER